jgi:hypothetical protein
MNQVHTTTFIFILIVSIIFIFDDLSKSALIMTFMVGFIVLSGNLNKLTKSREKLEDNLQELPEIPTIEVRNEMSLAEREYHRNASYDPPLSGINPIPPQKIVDNEVIIDSSIDSANTQMVRSRTRDKRVATAVANKDAGFFKRNYGAEFEEAERRQWWGNSEF